MSKKAQLHWSGEDIQGLLNDLIVQACSQQFENKSDILATANSEDGLGHWGLDSLSTWQVVSHVADFFQVQEGACTDAFLKLPNRRTLTDIALQGLNQNSAKLRFFTSGSQSKPKAVMHSLDSLLAEAAVWQKHLSIPDTVLVAIPQHHIYGFIWSVLMPKLWGATVIDIRSRLLNQLPDIGTALLVAVPAQVPVFNTVEMTQRDKMSIVLSAAPYEFEGLKHLKNMGFDQVWHIYGSTETGGMGFRNQQTPLYQLRDDLVYRSQQLWAGETQLPLQDKLVFNDDRQFSVGGRLDGQIQINGYNVDTQCLLDGLKKMELVVDAAVRVTTDETTHQKRIKAFIVAKLKDHERVIGAILRQYGQYLFAQNVTVGNALPRNGMGKLADW